MERNELRRSCSLSSAGPRHADEPLEKSAYPRDRWSCLRKVAAPTNHNASGAIFPCRSGDRARSGPSHLLPVLQQPARD
jgi:hypothetical protein